MSKKIEEKIQEAIQRLEKEKGREGLLCPVEKEFKALVAHVEVETVERIKDDAQWQGNNTIYEWLKGIDTSKWL